MSVCSRPIAFKEMCEVGSVTGLTGYSQRFKNVSLEPVWILQNKRDPSTHMVESYSGVIHFQTSEVYSSATSLMGFPLYNQPFNYPKKKPEKQ